MELQDSIGRIAKKSNRMGIRKSRKKEIQLIGDGNETLNIKEDGQQLQQIILYISAKP